MESYRPDLQKSSITTPQPNYLSCEFYSFIEINQLDGNYYEVAFDCVQNERFLNRVRNGHKL